MEDDAASPPWNGPQKSRVEQTSFKTDPDELPTPHALTPRGRHETAALYVFRFGRFKGRTIASVADSPGGRRYLEWVVCECDPRQFGETIREIRYFLSFADTYQKPERRPQPEPALADEVVGGNDGKNSPPEASRQSRSRITRGKSSLPDKIPSHGKACFDQESAESSAVPEAAQQPIGSRSRYNLEPKLTPFVDEWQYKEAAKHKLGFANYRGRKIGHINTLPGGYKWLVWVFENTTITPRNRQDIEMIGWFIRRSRDDLRDEKVGKR